MLELTRAPGEDWALVHHPADPRAAPGSGRHAGAGHWWVPAALVAALRAHGFVAGLRPGSAAVEMAGAAPASPLLPPSAGDGEATASAGHE